MTAVVAPKTRERASWNKAKPERESEKKRKLELLGFDHLLTDEGGLSACAVDRFPPVCVSEVDRQVGVLSTASSLYNSVVWFWQERSLTELRPRLRCRAGLLNYIYNRRLRSNYIVTVSLVNPLARLPFLEIAFPISLCNRVNPLWNISSIFLSFVLSLNMTELCILYRHCMSYRQLYLLVANHLILRHSFCNMNILLHTCI